MAEYLIIKREECPHCHKGFVNITDEMREALEGGRGMIPLSSATGRLTDYLCKQCQGRGWQESQVPLLDVLKAMEVFGAGYFPDNLKISTDYKYDTHE